MSLEQLEGFGFTCFGDRLALMQYCKKASAKSNPSSDDQHTSRLERLQGKVSSFSQKFANAGSKTNRLAGNKNAKRTTKVVYIGWLFCPAPGKECKQVRMKQGGGRRRCTVDIDILVSDLVEVSKRFFFPDDVSSFGKVTEFTFQMCSFDERVVPAEMTVDQICSTMGIDRLNLYLRSTRINPGDEDDNTAQPDLLDLPDDSDEEDLPEVTYTSDSEDFQSSSQNPYPSHMDAGTPTVRYIKYIAQV